MQYSQGFHPMPRLSFDNPLPVGMESEAEQLRIMVAPGVKCEHVLRGLNRHLPQGLQAIACRVTGRGEKAAQAPMDYYCIGLENQAIDSRALSLFLESAQWPCERQKSKGRRDLIDLKDCVRTIRMLDSNSLYMVLQRMDNYMVRPADVLRSIFKLTGEDLKAMRVLKLAKGLDRNESVCV